MYNHLDRSLPSAIRQYCENEELNLRTFGNKSLDQIFSFQKIQSSDVDNFKELLEKHCNDDALKTILIEMFNEKNCAFDMKNELQRYEKFPAISTEAAVEILKQIHAESSNIIVKRFIVFLLISVPKLIEIAEKKYRKNIALGYELFNDYFKTEFMPKWLRKHCADVDNMYGELSMINFICQSNELYHFDKIDKTFSIEHIESFEDIYKQILDDNVKLGGFNVANNFNKAVQVMSYLAPKWDSLCATVRLRDNSISSESMTGGSNTQYMDSDVVRAFTGEYNIVSSTQPKDSSVNYDFVADPERFNALSQDQQLRVSNFLRNNRKRFDSIVKNATKTIISRIDPAMRNSRFETEAASQISPSVSSFGFSGGANIQKYKTDISKFVNSLRSAYSGMNQNNVSDQINFVTHAYIPMLRRLNNKWCSQSNIQSSNILSNLSGKYDIIGVAADIPREYTQTPQTMSGGSEKIVYRDVPKIVYRDSPTENKNETEAAKIIRMIEQGQIEFNKSYEALYRKLTAAINNVDIKKVDDASISKLYPLIGLFNNIVIKSVKTTCFISGYYGAKDMNKAYTNALNATINGIKELGFSVLNECVSVLGEMKQLMINTAAKVRDLRQKLLTAPKKIASLVFVKVHIKEPCKLTNADFANMETAIGRLNAQIKNIEIGDKSTRISDSINDYMSAISDKDKVIKEHYDNRIKAIEYEYVSAFDTKSNSIKQIRTSIEKILCSSMLYFNGVFDSKLYKENTERMKNQPLSEDKIKHLENTILEFKSIQQSPVFKKLIKQIREQIEFDNDATVYSLLKLFKKLINEGHHLEFYEQVFKELNVFGSDFNWDEFKNNLYNIMILPSFGVTKLYTIAGVDLGISGSLTKAQLINRLAISFEEYCMAHNPTKADDSEIIKINDGYIFLSMLLNATLGDNVSGKTIDELMADYSRAGDGDNLEISNEKLPAGTTIPTFKANNNIYKTFSLLSKTNGMADHLPHCVKYCVAISQLLNSWVVAEGGETIHDHMQISTVNKDTAHNNVYQKIGFCDNADHKNETEITTNIIKALNAQVMAIIDQYWSVKYNGNIKIPTNIAYTLSGGAYFDSEVIHDHTTSAVITDAVPFYICALYLCEYYCTKFNDKGKNITTSDSSDEYSIRMKMNKISPLYPIYDIFANYKSTVQSFTYSQLNTALAILNDIWNNATGSSSQKLTQALDSIFNELNANFVFANDYQFKIAEVTRSFQASVIDTLQVSISKIINVMTETLENSVLLFNGPPEAENKAFESILNNAFKRVKDAPDAQKTSTLLSILQADKTKDQSIFDDYYKFMELVITPMITVADNYSTIFSVFSTVSIDGVTYANGDVELDDADWTNVLAVARGDHNKKSEFVDKDCVKEWNQQLLINALIRMHQTNKFTMPVFWNILDEHTYPTSKKLVADNKIGSNTYNSASNLFYIRQMWPDLRLRTLYDYYEMCIREFTAHYDSCIHNFLSYPGLSDKTIKAIAETAHNTISLGGKKSDKVALHYESKLQEDLYNGSKQYSSVNIPASFVIPPPPAYPIPSIVPVYNSNGISIPGLEISTNNVGNSGVRIGTSNVFINQLGNKPFTGVANTATCKFTWSDWILFELAQCDKINFCVPFNLMQTLTTNLPSVFTQPAYSSRTFDVIYTNQGNGAIKNIITENIVLRSKESSNENRSQVSAMNQLWVASLVSTIPYILSVLKVISKCADVNQVEDGESLRAIASRVYVIIKDYYNLELVNHTPYIDFMCDSITALDAKTNPHIFAELFQFVTTKNVSLMNSGDFIKMAWANPYFFGGLDEISFPEYKQKDKFDFIRKYAADKINNGVFHESFEAMINILGKTSWQALIAGQTERNDFVPTDYKEIDNTIVAIINIMSECDMKLVEQLINNYIAATNPRRTFSGGGYEMQHYKSINTEVNSYISKLLNGIARYGGSKINNVSSSDVNKIVKKAILELTKADLTAINTITARNITELASVKTLIKHLILYDYDEIFNEFIINYDSVTTPIDIADNIMKYVINEKSLRNLAKAISDVKNARDDDARDAGMDEICDLLGIVPPAPITMNSIKLYLNRNTSRSNRSYNDKNITKIAYLLTIGIGSNDFPAFIRAINNDMMHSFIPEFRAAGAADAAVGAAVIVDNVLKVTIFNKLVRDTENSTLESLSGADKIARIDGLLTGEKYTNIASIFDDTDEKIKLYIHLARASMDNKYIQGIAVNGATINEIDNNFINIDNAVFYVATGIAGNWKSRARYVDPSITIDEIIDKQELLTFSPIFSNDEYKNFVNELSRNDKTLVKYIIPDAEDVDLIKYCNSNMYIPPNLLKDLPKLIYTYEHRADADVDSSMIADFKPEARAGDDNIKTYIVNHYYAGTEPDADSKQGKMLGIIMKRIKKEDLVFADGDPEHTININNARKLFGIMINSSDFIWNPRSINIHVPKPFVANANSYKWIFVPQFDIYNTVRVSTSYDIYTIDAGFGPADDAGFGAAGKLTSWLSDQKYSYKYPNSIHHFIKHILESSLKDITIYNSENADNMFTRGFVGLKVKGDTVVDPAPAAPAADPGAGVGAAPDPDPDPPAPAPAPVAGGHMFKGGMNGPSLSLFDRLVNSRSPITGITAAAKFEIAYKSDKNDELSETNDGYNLYKQLFRDITPVNKDTNICDYMFALITNYFHKYKISFSSMFSQLCFPTIIYTAAVHDRSIKDFGKYDIVNDTTKLPSADTIKFISAYLSGDNYIDYALSYKCQINNGEKIQKFGQLNKTDDSYKFVCENMYLMPSLNGKYIHDIAKEVTPDSNNSLSILFNTKFLGHLRQLDIGTTFIYTLFLLLRHTSRYDLDHDTETSTFGLTKPEPFQDAIY